MEATVHGEIVLDVPEGFVVMDREGLDQAYVDDNPNRWGMSNEVDHMVFSVFWHKSGAVISLLSGPKEINRSTEKKLSSSLRSYGYRLQTFYKRKICGMVAYGFRHDYNLKDIPYVSDVFTLKRGRTCYTIYCYTRKECEDINRPVLESILDSMRFVVSE